MTGITVSRFILQCDGCDLQLGAEGTPFINAVEGRAIGYNAGWRMPCRIGVTGSPVRGSYDDVCPACLPAWTPGLTEQAKRKAARDAP